MKLKIHFYSDGFHSSVFEIPNELYKEASDEVDYTASSCNTGFCRIPMCGVCNLYNSIKHHLHNDIRFKLPIVLIKLDEIK